MVDAFDGIMYAIITIVLILLFIALAREHNNCGEYEYIDLLGNNGKSNDCHGFDGGLVYRLEGNGFVQVSQYKWVQKECKETTNNYFKES